MVAVDGPHHARPRLLKHLRRSRQAEAINTTTANTTKRHEEGAIRNSTRYPSLGPSNSSPDSFRIAGTTPKNGNVCRKVRGQKIFLAKHKQEESVSSTHSRPRLQGRGCGERCHHVSALKDMAQCVSHGCPAGGATVIGIDVHGERLTVSVCQKVSTMGHFFSPTTL